MIDLTISNTKLRDRAIRLVAEIVKCDSNQAAQRLELHHWNVRAALEETS
jgi:N-acetylmuramic acid 6-phosphate (MurNAc-6-P) etherase